MSDADGLIPSDKIARLLAKLQRTLSGDSLTNRAMRTTGLTIFGFGFAQGIRLLSTLILTRLLFPEAFGLMALVTVFNVGLVMFSDVGIGPAIIRSSRGDNPDFLNTAWTLQIIRGAILFLVGSALAGPVSIFYEAPILAEMLVISSAGLLIRGFAPTRLWTAQRHLIFGRVVLLELISQTISVGLIILLAFWLKSVWALVLGGLAAAIIDVLLMTVFLPGSRERLGWDTDAVWELVNFGKWIFLSTVCGFLLAQGDRLVLGKFLPLETFGIYNIGLTLGCLPMMLATAVTGRLLLPLYRDRPPSLSRENFLKLSKIRFQLTSALLGLLTVVALAGVWIVDVLYDDRYRAAGAVVVLVACSQIPLAIGLSYDQAALAVGDSKRFFIAIVIRSVLALAGILIGVQAGGLVGAVIGQGLAVLLAYPATVWLSLQVKVWDPLHDLIFATIGACCIAAALWLNWNAISALAT